MPYQPYSYMPNYYPSQNAVPDTLGQYKAPYQMPQQMGPQMPPAVPQNVPQSTNDVIWVQGLAGAKAYLIAPNNTVTLWDSESPTIYVKSADMNGVPSMRILDFTERTENSSKSSTEHVCKCGEKFVSKEQFEELRVKFDELSAKCEPLFAKKTTKTKEAE